MVRSIDPGARARRYDPFDELVGDGREAVEVGVGMQHGGPVDLRRGSAQQAGRLDRSVMPDVRRCLPHLG
jgi:hypothetical protein